MVDEWRPIVDEAKSEIVQHTLRVSSAISAHFMREFPTLQESVLAMTRELVAAVEEEVGEKLEALISKEQDNFTAQDVLLDAVNALRFKSFESMLIKSLDSIDPSVSLCCDVIGSDY